MTKSLTSVINARMHDGACPSEGCLGECPAIWFVRTAPCGGLVCGAAVYLWHGAKGLPMASVAEWFETAGCSDVVVSQVMHDPDEGTAEGVCEDGARPLTISFILDPERAASFGLSTPSNHDPVAAACADIARLAVSVGKSTVCTPADRAEYCAAVDRLTAALPGYLERQRQGSALAADAVPIEPVRWRCFHCDAAFAEHEAEAATLHFGASEHDAPACQISIEHVRWMEAQNRRAVDEDTEALRAVRTLANEHEGLRRRAEEQGYARGLADAKKHPEELGLIAAAPQPAGECKATCPGEGCPCEVAERGQG